ncbi:unnamed protein product [Parascedosporium putredinis]|uniref:RTA1-domain-containing protein n=1 Tax=Parascedosporium putredinis TaxID=1442378 RepID=A0A9P1GY24_9PEZI|nr:unnamed protein product [Parascedosporium putredinis]CAI7989562.1 unnamed protein product [Parascedosporium putredinis]
MNVDPPFGPVVNGTQIVVFYYYRPNQPAAYTFVALFGLATLGHLIYLIRLRSWFFIPFILGGIAETFGYFGRAQSSNNPIKAGPWILQNFLLLSSPPLLAATIYMALGRIIRALDASDHSMISPRWLTKLYILVDIGCLGLIVQLVALSIFVLLAWQVHRRTKRSPTSVMVKDPSMNWENHFRCVQLITVAIIVRSIVRMVEYIQGDGGFVMSHEVFIYLFDAALMFSVMLTYLILHPGRLVRDARRLRKSHWGLDGTPLVKV